MRTIIIAMAVAATGLSAMPASAQNWRMQPTVQREIRSDINQLRNQIDRAAQRRAISPREATGLRRDARDLRQLYQSYSRNGLTRSEVARLESGVNRIHQRLRLERRDWDGRRG